MNTSKSGKISIVDESASRTACARSRPPPFVTNAVGDKYAEEYPIEALVNRGRHYGCPVVDHEGHTIEKLLVVKQTGDVQFV